jgi:8-oxo-dGTP diphosphatase
MFPGGRKRRRETCLRREINEELPKLKLGRLTLWKELTSTNRRSGRRMSDAIFITNKATGLLKIGDKRELDRAVWRKPHAVRLTPTSRYIRDKLFPKIRRARRRLKTGPGRR